MEMGQLEVSRKFTCNPCMYEGGNYWVNLTLVLGEVNALYLGFGKAILLEQIFRIRDAHENLLSPN